MKFFSALTGMLLLAAVALAAGSLKENMEEADKLFRQIRTNVTDVSKNAASVQLTNRMNDLFKVMVNQIPESFQKMPAGQREAAIADYIAMMQGAVVLGGQLQAAFTANDNAAAVAIAKKLNDLKTRSHDKYNP